MRSSLVFASIALLVGCVSGGDPASSDDDIIRASRKVTVNDVSVLVPLPNEAAGVELMLQPESEGAKGMLLPRPIFDALPDLVELRAPGAPTTTFTKEQMYRELAVVALRFDPCFPREVRPTTNCQAQVRMVLQPITTENGVAARDAAVHLFFELTQDAFRDVAMGLANLRDDASAGDLSLTPLGVQPVLAREGLAGPYARGLRELVLAHCGAQNLVRVAVMLLRRDADQWSFAQFDVAKGTLSPRAIPNITEKEQSVGLVEQGDHVAGTISPEPAAGVDSAVPLTSFDDFGARPEAERQALLGALVRIENPTKHDPTTIDCVSCHMATNTRQKAESVFRMTAPAADRFASTTQPTTLTSESAGRVKVLRAFGYSNRKTAISQRVANESAAVAQLVNDAILR